MRIVYCSLIISISLIFMSVGYTAPHFHGVRSHSHPLPAHGLEHQHNGGAIGIESNVSKVQCGLNNKFIHKTKHHGKRLIHEDQNSLFFTAPMAVNTDGAPNSYHPDDPWGNQGKAINVICNGANVVLPSGKKINYSNCKELVKSYREAKKSGWNNTNKPRVDFYGVATTKRDKYVPCINTSEKYKGYFVSTTAQAANNNLGRCDQNRYLNSLELPFTIYPGHSNFIKRGVGKRDIAVLYNPDKDTLEYAIIGDRGPKWGLSEGSVFLAKTLKNKENNPKNRRDTYNFTVKKTHTLILSKGSILPPYTLEKIRKEGKIAFQAWGGRERFNSCIALHDS